MRLKIIFAFFSLIFSISATAQLQWPAVNNTMKPWTRWWWQGSAVNKDDLSKNLQAYSDAGLGGVEITPIYGVHGYEKDFISYLSAQWMQMLAHTIQQSKKLGLGVDLANGTGWPFGGPWVAEKDASVTVYHKTWKLNSGKQLPEQIRYHTPALVRTANNRVLKPEELFYPLNKNIDPQSLSLDQLQYESDLLPATVMAYGADGQSLDLTSKVDSTGTLNWLAPKGVWTVLALFTGLHGKMVERAAPGGEGYAIDHFSATATRGYLKHFDKAFKGFDVSGIRSFFNDSYEVDDARGQSNWTSQFFKEFAERKKYKLEDHLPALFGLDHSDTNAQILYDYRSVIDELLLEHFTITWKQWASQRGAMVRNQSHGSPANTLDLYSVVDIPETEGNDILRFKFASSAGNVSGKTLVSAEAATWLNEHFLSDWADVKKAVDLFFLGGVNHIFYHGTAYSPSAAPWPGWLFYAAVHFQPVNPMWKDFPVLNKYITRTQSFLQSSRPDNDILVYYPIADQYAKPGKAMLQHFDGMENNFEETDFKRLSEWMLENDYQFDFFSPRQLMNFSFEKKIFTQAFSPGKPAGEPAGKTSIKSSESNSNQANGYSTILLSGNTYISPPELAQLIKLAKKGATITVYKNMPSKVPGFGNHTKSQFALDSMLNTIKFKVEGLVSVAAVGKGSFIVSEDIGALLRTAKTRNETLHSNGLSFIRKSNKQGSLYLVTNSTGKDFNGWISLSALVKNGSAGLFNPMTGLSGMLELKAEGKDSLETYIHLAPDETVIIQVYNQVKSGKLYRFPQRSGAAIALNGGWTTTFIDGGPVLPATFTSVLPELWTGRKDSTADNFSGTARYSTQFDKPAGSVQDWELDLGKVYHTAEVFLNGKSLGACIGPEFKWIISSKQLMSTNKLEIVIANLMANRISYMDRNNLAWKIFYNTNMPARKKENSKNGLFDASGWKPLPSGMNAALLTPLLFQERR